MNDKKKSPFVSIVQTHLEAPKTTEKIKRKTRTKGTKGATPNDSVKSKPVAEKEKSPKPGVELDDLTRLRTLYWFRRILALTGCKPSEIEKKYVIDIKTPEFGLYAIGRRKPLKSSLKAIDRAFEIGSNELPLKQSSLLYVKGPDGARLWDVLSGDIEACRSIVEDFYVEEFGESALLNSNFDEKINYIFEMFKLEPEDLEFLKQRSEQWKVKAFHQTALLWIALTHEKLGHVVYLNFKKGIKYPFELLVVALALREIAYKDKTHIAEIDYLAMGVFRVLVESMPEVKPELIEYIQSHISKSHSGLFNPKKLEGMEYFDSLSKRGLF